VAATDQRESLTFSAAEWVDGDSANYSPSVQI
jgi:hypothetical protein